MRAASIRRRPPQPCGASAEEVGITLNIAVVTGDDLTAALTKFAPPASPKCFPARPCRKNSPSVNAYLGAQPIALALDAAPIRHYGRCVDFAVVLGPLVHAFGWSWTDYDKLAQGASPAT